MQVTCACIDFFVLLLWSSPVFPAPPDVTVSLHHYLSFLQSSHSLFFVHFCLIFIRNALWQGRYRRVGSCFADRVFVNMDEIRDLLLRWSGRLRHLRNGKVRPPFQQSETPHLLQLLDLHTPFLSPLVRFILDTLNLDVRERAYRDFVAELAYPSCVGGGLFKNPDVIRPLLVKLGSPSLGRVNGPPVTVEMAAILTRFFPVLMTLFEKDAMLCAGLPPHFHPILQVTTEEFE